MSDMARKAREANKAKAHRMTRADPGQKVDASDWTPSEPMNASAQTGMRPVSERQFRRGGKVHGEKPTQRADRKPRKAGGRVDEYVNRDVRKANAELGKPHVGGFKAGGGTNFRRQMQGDMKVDGPRSSKRNGGGQYVKRSHKDVGGMLSMLSPSLMLKKKMEGRDIGSDGLKRGGRAHKAHGGNIDSTGMRPTGDRIPRKTGGRTKSGKTNIVISIAPSQAQPAASPPQMMPKPPMGVPVPPPMPPQGPPPIGLGAGGPQMPPPMPRKAGGRATYPTIASAKRVKSPKDMDAGSLGGLGRIEKTAIAERTYARAK